MQKEIYDGDVIEVGFDVSNLGDQDVATVKLALKVDGEEFPTLIAGIKAGGKVSYSFPFPSAKRISGVGTHTVSLTAEAALDYQKKQERGKGVNYKEINFEVKERTKPNLKVDPENTIDEENEDDNTLSDLEPRNFQENNIREIEFEVEALRQAPDEYIDLSVEDLGFPDGITAADGETITIQPKMKNNGNITARAAAIIKVDGREVEKIDYLRLEPNQLLNVRFGGIRVKLSGPGTHIICVALKPDRGQEHLEPKMFTDNNTQEGGVTVEGKFIDLAIEEVWVEDTTVREGDTIIIQPKVTNYGNTKAEDAVPTISFDGQDHGRIRSLYAVSPHRTSLVDSVRIKAPRPGRYRVVARVEPSIAQSTLEPGNLKDNNTGEIEITVEEEAELREFIDLEVETVGLSSEDAVVSLGESFLIYPRIRNNGNIRVLSVQPAVEFDGYPVQRTPPRISLGPGESQSLHHYGFLIAANTPGIHRISVTVEPSPEQSGLEPRDIRDNNELEADVEVEDAGQGAVSADFSQVKEAVKRRYNDFRSHYAGGNINGVLQCISRDWESSTGQSFYDLTDRLNRIFTTFDRLTVDIGGLSIQPSEDSEYVAKVTYSIKIEGCLSSNPDIKHLEQGQVTEYITKDAAGYLIGKTVGQGAF